VYSFNTACLSLVSEKVADAIAASLTVFSTASLSSADHAGDVNERHAIITT
jgi:hypothetical protein